MEINDLEKMIDIKISVIIPVRNQGERIEKCLKGIFQQTLKPYEVIIVDGHSTDQTVEIARHFPTKIIYEEYGTRGGACQSGLEAATGEFIAFTDGDCIPDNDWLETLYIGLKDDSVVGAGGKIINSGSGLWIRSINLAMDTFLGSANSIQGRNFEEKRFVDSISGCNSIYQKKLLVKAGGFNTKLITLEDTELNQRMIKFGKLIYIPEAIIVHDHGRGLKDFGKRMYQYGLGRGECFIYNLQVIPPFLGVITILLLFLWKEAFLIVLFSYFIMVAISTLSVFSKYRDIKYLLTIPIVYFIEHVLYSIGLYSGLLKNLYR